MADTGLERWGCMLNIPGPTSYTNPIANAALYTCDPLNRKTNELSVGVTTNRFIYNGANTQDFKPA